MNDILNKLKTITDPSMLQDLSIAQLNKLSQQIREFLIETVSETGGHFSSNLGSVDIIIALYHVFNWKNDHFYYDTGHQAYAHKILTGRAAGFTKNFRQKSLGGIEGFLKMSESEFDIHEGGRSGTTLGLALGHNLAKQTGDNIAIIGDASIQSGVALESLNMLSEFKQGKVIIVLNGNLRSISKGVGAMQKKLYQLPFKKNLKNIKEIFYSANAKNNILFVYDIAFLGPIDGHDIEMLTKAFAFAKNYTKSILVYVKTVKGKGYLPAEEDKTGIYHSIPAKFDFRKNVFPKSTNIKQAKIIANAIKLEMHTNNDLYAFCCGMGGPNYSNLLETKTLYPERVFDIGISEAAASLFAAGLANAKQKVYLEYYSAFATRALDIFINDFSRVDLPACIALFDCGFTPTSGSTNHVLYDIGIYANLYNVVISQPSSIQEAYDLVHTAINYNKDKLFFIRVSSHQFQLADYQVQKLKGKQIEIGKWKYFYKPKIIDAYVISCGRHLNEFKKLIQENNLNIALVNALFIKPIDKQFLNLIFNTNKNVFVFDENYWNSGLGAQILLESSRENFNTNKIKILGSDIKIYHSDSLKSLYKQAKIDYTDCMNLIKKTLKK